ncbi:hypothetical protein CAEBREN_10890 [Caenorhabditis brenneri]|uniref:Uncharacterized protein n=1 Tax=Caenorhabditis brenneri TaxID=135651 RepID=G0NYS9_CAEBE|nr:hypothetical protein CAEBREN_10890 [Caenorhabditis brenneri]
MKRYNGTSELSVYQGQETASLLKRVSPDEDYPIQSFPESVSSTDIARKMKRYNATSELSLYKEQETTSVLVSEHFQFYSSNLFFQEQTSSCAPLPAQSLPETDSPTEKNSPVAKDVINDGGHASPRLACSEFDDGHELGNPEDKKASPSNQMILDGSVSNEQEKAQPATNGRYWFEETPESFDAIERVQSANGSNSSDSTESTANVEHKAPSKEQKKTGLFSCWRVPLLKKHKKVSYCEVPNSKQTRSDELNGDQTSTVAISTTADTFVTSEPVDTVEAPNPVLFTTLRDCSTFFRVPYNPISPAKAHEIEAARIRMEAFLAEKALAEKSNGLATANNVNASAGTSQVHKTDPLPKSAGSSNNDCPVATDRQDQKQKTQPIIPKFVWRPDEQISPASKKDLANAEKRMQMYFASKNLSMPGAASSGKPVGTAPSTSGTSTSTAGVPVGSAEALKNVFAVQLPK